nr:uncharacterized protein LOC128705539 [Cherax quadricarinatus]
MAQARRRRVNTVCIVLTSGAVTGPSMELLLPAIIRDTYGIAKEEICGLALNGTKRIFVKFSSATVYEAVVNKFQEVAIPVNHAVTVRLHDVSSYYTWVKIRNVPFEADASDIRFIMCKYGTIHTITAGRWSAGPYMGIPEGAFSVKMTLRHPIPSYVVMEDFRTQVFVTYAGQRSTCHLCGSYDHLAAQCERRRGDKDQQQRRDVEERREDQDQLFSTLPQQSLTWSEEVERAEEKEMAGATRGDDINSLDVVQVLDEVIAEANGSDAETTIVSTFENILGNESPCQDVGTDLDHGSAVEEGVVMPARPEVCRKDAKLVRTVEVEVHHGTELDDLMQVEGTTRKRAAVLSDSDDVLTPAQRPGKKTWAEAMRRGSSGAQGQGLGKGGQKGGGRKGCNETIR